MVIELPPPSDLEVVAITVPLGAQAGEPLHLEWTVTNNAAQSASGSWTDAVYLSRDATWDITDRPLGRNTFSGILNQNGTYTLALDTTMPGVTPGDYRIIVRTDVFNQIYEGVDEANNRTASPDAVSLSVDPMQIDIPKTVNLKPGQERLYKITVPQDETLRVTLSADNDTSVNEIYIRHDQVPTSAAFDATYEGPLASDLVAIVPSTEPGSYYIMVRGFSGPAEGTNITLLAELLPLVITNVHTDVGGDSKFVTTTISGAQFHPDAIVKLVRPDIAEFEPAVWKVIDSTKIIATFDLTGAPHGLYDVVVTNPSGDRASVPYRFLVERAIEADVTIGVGGPRVILAGDQATYSVALQNLSNVDAPYVYFQVGIPQLLINPIVYGLPYVTLATNVRGTPEGAAGTPNESTPWINLESITNTTGQLLTSGYLYDQAADGFGGFSFNVSTYPGLKEMHDKAFDAFRAQMAKLFPDLDTHLESGAGGIEAWWEAVKEKAEEIQPGMKAAMDALDFVGLYNQNAAVPDECVIPFIPFRFHVVAAATTMTRDEYVAQQTRDALALRQAILTSSEANGPLLALVADSQIWVDLWLAALEDAGLLRPEGAEPPVREQQHIVSLMATLASGILFGPAGNEVRSSGDLLGFFEQLRTLYGHEQNMLAEIEYWDPRESDCYEGSVPVPAIPLFEDYNLALSQPTHFEAFRIYVPWMAFEERGAGLPIDFQINGPQAVGGAEFAQLDFSKLFQSTGATGSLASLTGPQTAETAGWLPAGQALPYTVNFQNDPGATTFVNEIQVVTQLDPDLDAHTFELGDIKIGDITIDVPEGRWFYQAEQDFTDTRGFILRVSAGIDLYQDPASARWVIQAIDPLTGEVLQDTTRGLLKPNDAQGNGAGFISYSVKPKEDLPTGRAITASARVLFDTQAPQDTATIMQVLDGRAPATELTVERLGSSDNYDLRWTTTDDFGGSGFKHVTLYVATDGGDFKIWQRKLAEPSGTLVYSGEAGHTYEFLALATDLAGNQEKPARDQNATTDDSGVSLGALPRVPGTTPPNFGIAPEPAPEPSTNPFFLAATQGVPTAVLSTRPSEFDQVLHPFAAQAFVTGIPASQSGIGPMAIAEAPDDTFLVSGGSNRGSLWRVGHDGAAVGDPLITLDQPIFNLAFDQVGRLWATTGGEKLLQLDPTTGGVLASYGSGVQMGIAIAEDGRIYLGTANGIEIFDPATGLFSQFSRDLDLRVGSLAFAADGVLWATTWPDRRQVVRFNERGRAEVMLTFDSDIDSLAFGRQGTPLQDLLFVSHNSGAVTDTGAAAASSELTMVDLATLKRVAVATGGTRGDNLIATSDGRLLISQSNQIDVVNPIFAPEVVATNPPEAAVVPLPFPFIRVTFDQDMFAGDPTSSASVINAQNYVLSGATGGVRTIQSLVYESATRTVFLGVGTLTADEFTLTVKKSVTSVFGQRMVSDYVTDFTGIADLSAVLDVTFDRTRFDRATGTVSYDVTVTNKSSRSLILPVLLALDPADGFAGLPLGTLGQSDDGRWLIDLSDTLPPNGELPAGDSTTGHTVQIVTSGRARLEFASGVIGGTTPNTAPTFVSVPPGVAVVGEEFVYDADATDAEGDPLIYHLFSGPPAMTIDPLTGLLSWTPPVGTAVETPVVVQVFDGVGASTIQRFVLTVADGNRAPRFVNLPTEITGAEGEPLEVTILVTDENSDPLTVWADGLPMGASFDPLTRKFSWTPSYDSAGNYQDLRFIVSDGITQTIANVPVSILPLSRPVSLVAPESRTLAEGERIVIRLVGIGEEGAPLTFETLEGSLPYGATLNPDTGVFEWTPTYIQAGTYDVKFWVDDGQTGVTRTTRLTVLNANGAPVFEQMDGWEIFENQLLSVRAFAFDPDNPFYVPPVLAADGTNVAMDDFPPSVTVRVIGDLPPGATFDAATWDLRWRPDYLQAGTYSITFEAVDDGNGTGVPKSVRQTLEITVLNLNQAPILQDIENVVVERGTVREITLSAADPENNPLTFLAASEQPGYPLPPFMALTDNGDGTATLRIAPGIGDRGDHAIRVLVSDNGDGTGIQRSDDYVFVVKVTSENEPPVLQFLGNAVAVPGEALNILVPVSDLDGDVLTYELTGLPAPATIGPTAIYGQGLIQWTPTAADIGIYNASVKVTDTGNGGTTAPAFATIAFNVTVRAANTAPLIVPVGAKTVTEGEPLAFQLRGLDAESDGLTFTSSQLPNGATFNRQTGEFAWTPRLDQAGQYQVTFTASDGNKASSETVAITVANANQAPIFIPMLKQLAREGAELSFNVVANDGDADAVLLRVVSRLPEGALFVPQTGEFQWTPGFDQQGDHVVRFEALDGSGASALLDVTIAVANINRAPIVEASDRAALIGVPVDFTVAARDLDIGAVLEFGAEGLPEGATLDAATGRFTWTPGPGQEGDHFVTFIVSDGEAATRQTIVVRASLQPVIPSVRIELTPAFPALPGQAVLVHPVADSLSDIVSLKLFVDGVEVALDSEGRALVTPSVPGKIVVRAVAVDADGVTGETTTILKVRDPSDHTAPVLSFNNVRTGLIVSGMLAVSGQVADQNLDFWRLELVPGFGSGPAKVLASGEAAISGALGSLDPAQFVNGVYTLRLTAGDISGKRRVLESRIEINSDEKLGQYQRATTDLSVTLGGVPFDLIREYDSFDDTATGRGSLGLGWSFRGFDLDLETNVPPTGREILGVFNAFSDTTRLYVTLPGGERTAFSFIPEAEPVGPLSFWRPGWVADDPHGWTLTSADQLLSKSGARYYDTATGLGYNPAAIADAAPDYVLTAPDGTKYLIDALRGVTEINTPDGKRLFVSDSGVVGINGESLRFIKNADGAVERVLSPSGETMIYTYDDQDRLSAMRKLSDGSGERYGYDADGMLIAAVQIGGIGEQIRKNPDGSIAVRPITADLGGLAQFTGQAVTGSVAAGDDDVYTFSIRRSEIASAAGGTVLLRVAVTGAGIDVPELRGIAPSSIAHSGNTTVAIFSIRSEGLYQINLSGNGVYEIALAVGGDLDLDADVDAADSALFDAGGPSADVNGDGVVDLVDRQVINMNFGLTRNAAPVIASVMPDVLTHEDLPIEIDLAQIASDPDGDRMFFRVVSAENGFAALSAREGFVTFTPTDGFTGTGRFRIIADDGFTSSAIAEVEVDVSDARLLSIDFLHRRIQTEDIGAATFIQVIGDFADQQDALLPLWYVNGRIEDTSIATLSQEGVLISQAIGSTIMRADRGDLHAATVIGVGSPEDDAEYLTKILGIDAYPDAVTILADGGIRQVVTQVGTIFVDAADGVRYFSADDGIATVDANGLIRAVSEGTTQITVIHGYGEEILQVKVDGPPVVGIATIGKEGGAVANTDGYVAMIGPGQVKDGDAVVSIETVAEQDLALPMPDNMKQYFNFAAAFDLTVSGADVTGPVQIAAPLKPGVALPGEEVYFFQKQALTISDDGALTDVWTIIDSGIVGDDGVARSTSPPFPGLTDRGQVLVAKAAHPSSKIRIDLGLQAAIMAAFLPAIGIAAVGGIAGAAVATGLVGGMIALMLLPIQLQVANLQLWRKYANNEVDHVDLNIQIPQTPALQTIIVDLPPPPPGATTQPPGPDIRSVKADITDQGDVKLTIKGTKFFSIEDGQDIRDARVVFKMGGRSVAVYGSEFVDAFSTVDPLGGPDLLSTIVLSVPDDVLLGLSEIFVQRPTKNTVPIGATSWPDGVEITSNGVEIDNQGGFGFISGQTDNFQYSVNVIDLIRMEEPGVADEAEPNERIIKQLTLTNNAAILDIVNSPDLSRVFVATQNGIAVLDAFTLQQFDVNPDTDAVDFIPIEGGVVHALAIDPNGQYLYAAGTGKVHVINLNPGSPTYHKVATTITGINAPNNGLISSLAVNADGTRLFAGVPHSTAFGFNSWVRGNGERGEIVVINVDNNDRPLAGQPNTRHWREVIGTKGGFMEPREIKASRDRDRLIFTALGDRINGLHTITIINDDPTNFRFDVKTINLRINKEPIGVTYIGIPGPNGLTISNFSARSSGQVFDLDIRYPSGVAVTPDLTYAFVGDYDISRYLTMEAMAAMEMEELHNTGGKIGIIENPFGINGAPKLVASTTPIPMAFLEDLQVDASGKKLYANYRGTSNILVFDIDKMKTKIASNVEDWTRLPLDRKTNQGADFAAPNINLPGIDTQRYGRGLSLQIDRALELVRAQGVVDMHGDGAEPLVFEWKVNLSKLGITEYQSNLYVSALPPEGGLWPDDPWFPREDWSENPDLDLDGQPDTDESMGSLDTNPRRLITSQVLQSGKVYELRENGGIFDTGRTTDADFTRVEVDDAFRQKFTAGQFYYWGVRLKDLAVEASTIISAKAAETDGFYSEVTILTHGFQLDPTPDLANESFRQPDSFMALGELISLAGGGGVVLQYDKNTGRWVDRENDRWDLAALIPGKPVVLVSDWYRESDISDSGYSEAAADALFASLVRLNQQTNGNLFSSPMHFIGHSRGTVVNSEIIQRMGTYFPSKDDIHMTTLDPHDFNQKSLNVPLRDLIDDVRLGLNLAKLAVSAAGLAGFTIPLVGTALSVLQILTTLLARATDTLKYIGVQIKPLTFGDFKDPNVLVWENVSFADNYYQEAAHETPTNQIVFNSRTFTATPNGTSIPGNKDVKDDGSRAPMPAIYRAPDININMRNMAGFKQDDFEGVSVVGGDLGLGGPHSRVTYWYAGTASVNTLQFGDPIWRRASDQGVPAPVLGFAVPGNRYDDDPWYTLAPRTNEGVGNGWYFSAQGGGLEFRPSNSGVGTPVTFNNTEVTTGTNSPAVPTVFNGDFENGTKQSLINYLIWRKLVSLGQAGEDLPSDMGRAPLSYELPGWSMHGGTGFKVQIPGLGEKLDISGLFATETSPTEYFKTISKLMLSHWVDGLLQSARQAFTGIFPTIPVLAPIPVVGAWETSIKNAVFSKLGGNVGATVINKYLTSAGIVNKLISLVPDMLNNLLTNIGRDLVSTPGAPAQPLLTDVAGQPAGPTGLPLGADNIKDYLNFGIDQAVKALFPSASSDYALLIGASNVMKTIVENALPDGVRDLRTQVLDFLDHFELNNIQHNRMLIPQGMNYLRFNVFTPMSILPDAKIQIIFTDTDNNVSAPLDVIIKEGLFSSNEYYVEIPQQFREKIVTFEVKHVNMGATAELIAALDDMAFIELFESAAIAVVGGLSQVMLIDDFFLSPVATGTPLMAASEGTGASEITTIEAQALADVALGLWADSNLLDPAKVAMLSSLTISVENLGGSVLAYLDDNDGTIHIDSDAAGYGWFVDSTPTTSEEFTVDTKAWLLKANAGQAAFDRIDLLTVIAHEMGHAAGLLDVPLGVQPKRLMTGMVSTGERRLPSIDDLGVPEEIVGNSSTTDDTGVIYQRPAQPASNAVSNTLGFQADLAPATNVDFVNGIFDIATGQPGFGWTTVGDVAVANGVALLTEDDQVFTGLSQTFLVDPASTKVTFTLNALSLIHSSGQPPDAIEVALIDGVTGNSILAGITGLPGSDAVLNVQADGSVYFAPGVGVSGVFQSGDKLTDLSVPITVIVSLAPAVAGRTHLLSFDLLGFGAQNASVQIDNVAVLNNNIPPVSADDAFVVEEDVPTALPLFANDSDPDGDPLTPVIVSAPTHGTLSIVNGQLVYTSHLDYFGDDSFTYRASDRFAQSDVSTVAVTVTPVNDAPVIAALPQQSVDEGDTLTVTLTASDPDNSQDQLTFTLIEAPAGAAIDPATGVFSWTADDGPAIRTVKVKVGDTGQASSERTFTIKVNDVAPSYVLSGASSTLEGQVYTLEFSTTDPGLDTVQFFTINWGDGSAPQQVPGNETSATHVYPAAGPVMITTTLTNEDGTFSTDPFPLTVLPQPVEAIFGVVNFTGGQSTLAVRFNEALDLASLTTGGTDPTLLLTDENGNPIEGTVTLDPDGMGFVFTFESGALRTGTYTLTMLGSPGGSEPGVRSLEGRGLDGDGDQEPGGTYQAQFVVTAGQSVPIATDDEAETLVNTSVMIDILGNDIDPGGDPLTPQLFLTAEHGTLTFLQNGMVLYTPDTGYVGEDTFQYFVTDGEAQSGLATVLVNVLAVGSGRTIGADQLAFAPSFEQVLSGEFVVGAQPVFEEFSFGAVAFANFESNVATLFDQFSDFFGSSGAPEFTGTLPGNACTVRAIAETPFARFIAPALVRTGSEFGLVMRLPKNAPAEVTSWSVDWGDGQVTSETPGAKRYQVHKYDKAGSYRIKIIVVTETGKVEVFLVVNVDDRLNFVVNDFSALRDGFTIRFNRAFDTRAIERLEDGAPGDVTLDIPGLGQVTGSIVVDPDASGFRFRTGQPLSAGDYLLRLRSGIENFHDQFGCNLDGDANGVPGDDYLKSFEVAPPRGTALPQPGKAASLRPETLIPSDLPVAITTAGGMNEIAFKVGYDPRLLRITGAAAGRDLPAGATLDFAPGPEKDGAATATVSVKSPVPLPAGPLYLANLKAGFVADVPAGSKSSLEVTIIEDKPVQKSQAPAASDAPSGPRLPVSVSGGELRLRDLPALPQAGERVTLALDIGAARTDLSLAFDPARYAVESIGSRDAQHQITVSADRPGRLELSLAASSHEAPRSIDVELRALTDVAGDPGIAIVAKQTTASSAGRAAGEPQQPTSDVAHSDIPAIDLTAVGAVAAFAGLQAAEKGRRAAGANWRRTMLSDWKSASAPQDANTRLRIDRPE